MSKPVYIKFLLDEAEEKGLLGRQVTLDIKGKKIVGVVVSIEIGCRNKPVKFEMLNGTIQTVNKTYTTGMVQIIDPDAVAYINKLAAEGMRFG